MKFYRELKKDEKANIGDVTATKVCTGVDGGGKSLFKDTKEVTLREVSVDDTTNTVKGSIAKNLRKFASFIEKK